jgi:CMP-N-acetylneuraminic acid synthetase
MIPALAIGREGSTGFPGKNVSNIFGRPLCWYPMKAAKESSLVDTTYVSTDFDEIMDIAHEMGVNVIKRDPELATSDASSKDAFKDGYETITEREDKEIEAVVLLFCNSPIMTASMIDNAIESLCEDENLDSVVPVSKYSMRSPVRAHKIEDDRLTPFFNPGKIEGASTDRDTQADTYFADCSFFVVRPNCLHFESGQPPFPWIGTNIRPLRNWGGLDIDFEWQVPQARYWLREHGFSEDQTPYDSS